ncbi:cell division protein FtsX [Alkalilimnicola ehrlichii]|uniref:Cell division protein FtsX n=1 Tax=Alkalilimnicola ehrlichii TaxID=351052 RepID=A0A3E0WWL6_9GAMM|nr:permease-like cell division protein FtsX [Alkalilimnicola ehrlichii]RFA30053.1 cell division protein FtsX [Alkalilimnicola ehrlichii]RFA37394.1 cell division protein FtsX [Alkalilimnicola ehrlichii]
MAAGNPRARSNRLRQSVDAWGSAHLRALFASLGRLYRAPLPSLMTAAVIAIALALPAGFLLMLANAERVVGSWEGNAQISLFLELGTDAEHYRALARELRGHTQIDSVDVITPEAALEEFRRLSGFQEAMDLLDDNPLPPVLVVRPVSGLTPAEVDELVGDLQTQSAVEQLRLDQEWLQRLHGIMQLIQRGIWVIAVLLAVAVILVVGNTIRLDIQNRRDEIVVAKLIGATDAFIRRPFLYEGIWYGIAGGLLAALLIEVGRLLLGGPARELAVLYGSSFSLQGLGFVGILRLTLAGSLLGLLGSWTAVGRHLAAIEPR